MSEIMRRYIDLSPELQLRAELDDDGDEATIRGHAAVFDQVTEIWRGFKEVIRRGAFKKSLKDGPDVVALWNHNADFPLARRSTGDLELSEDDVGLAMSAKVSTADQLSRFFVDRIARKIVSKMSFAFREVKYKDNRDNETGEILREQTEVLLVDVSPVTYPAYDGTDVGLRRRLEAATARSGIEIPDLVGILTRAKGERLASETDRAALRSILERLGGLLGEPLPLNGGTGEIAEGVDTFMLARKIQLAELELELG